MVRCVRVEVRGLEFEYVSPTFFFDLICILEPVLKIEIFRLDLLVTVATTGTKGDYKPV